MINIYNKNQYKNVNFFSMLVKLTFAIDNPSHLFSFNIKNLSLLLENNSINTKKKIFSINYWRWIFLQNSQS